VLHKLAFRLQVHQLQQKLPLKRNARELEERWE